MKIILTMLLALVPLSATRADILISNPYIRATPPVVPNSAAFMRLSNTGNAPVFLTSANTSAAKNSEIHAHENTDGVMKMHLIEKLEIPARSAVHLEPGGLHLMIFDLKQPLMPGMTIPMVLNFSDGTSHKLRLPVMNISLGE